MPTLAVEIFFATGSHYSAWSLGTGALGRVTLAPADIATYVDVTSAVRSLRIDRGKARELDEYESGRASVDLDNRDRDFDPLNLSGPYVSLGVTQVRPGRRIRIKATHPTTLTQYSIFTGTIRDWQLGYNRTDATTTARCSDAMTDLANVDITTVTSAGLSGVAAGEVLGVAGISLISVDAGQATLQATTFTNVSALSAMQTLEASEQGSVYADEANIVQFADRHAILSESRSNTSQATFGTGNLPYTEIALEYSSDLIKNNVTVTRTGGVAQTSTDATSVTAYGKKSYGLSGMALSTDVQALATAAYIVSGYKDPAVRVSSITIASQYHADTMTQALSRQIRDRVTVQFAPPGGGTISQELFIEGIEHSVSPQGQMATRFTFSSTATAFGWSLGTGALDTTTILGF